MTTTLKQQLEQWIEYHSDRCSYDDGTPQELFKLGAHNILPMLLVAVEALEEYKSAAFDINGTIYKVGYRAEETLNKIKQMIDVDNG